MKKESGPLQPSASGEGFALSPSGLWSRSGQMEIELGFDTWSYASIPCLEFLWGHPFDDLAKAWLPALRPSSIRVSRDSVKCDTRCWRVTVMLNRDDTIAEITQEVEVGLPDGIEHGHDLTCKSPDHAEPKWNPKAARRDAPEASEGST